MNDGKTKEDINYLAFGECVSEWWFSHDSWHVSITENIFYISLYLFSALLNLLIFFNPLR